MHHFINNQGHEINLNIHAELAAQSGVYALTDTIKVMTITRVWAESGFILPETCPLQSMEQGPPGLKVTLYHWEKSLRWGGETNLHSPVPIPPALHLTSLLVLWWAEHMHVVTPGKLFFPDLFSLHNWLFSTFVTLKYSWRLPRCCPPLHRVHWYVACLNSVMSIKTLNAHVSQSYCNINSKKSFTLAFFPLH